MGTALEPGLPDAAADYRWLLDRGYPDQPALAIVGDRYRLSSVGRAMLYRGVYSSADSTRRAGRLVDGAGSEITVDGHNVLFTAWNCLVGRPIIAATDGFIRDIGGTRSRLPHDERFTRIATVLCDALVSLRPAAVTVLLDEPLPWSREHAAELREIWARVGHSVAHRVEIRTEASVDATVAAAARGVIATSDTAIVDRCAVPVVDLGGLIVRSLSRAEPLDMAGLIRTCTR
ncbi:MAG: DUF434 domain-containing protein [Spirochaetota bacterium]